MEARRWHLANWLFNDAHRAVRGAPPHRRREVNHAVIGFVRRNGLAREWTAIRRAKFEELVAKRFVERCMEAKAIWAGNEDARTMECTAHAQIAGNSVTHLRLDKERVKRLVARYARMYNQ